MLAKALVGVSVTSVVLSQSLAYITSINSSSLNVLSEIAMTSIVIQWIVFIHASGVLGNPPTEKYYDLTGAITFGLTTIRSILFTQLNTLSLRNILATSSVLIWCTRLGYHLFGRSLREGGIDSRFTEIKKNWHDFGVAWTLQGLWVFLTAFPVFVLNATTFSTLSTKQHYPMDVISWIGYSIWIFGFLFEVIADEQKKLFRDSKKNHDQFIHTGLWAISRHPNYFGEICCWFGLYLLCLGGYTTWIQKIITCISPLFVSLLLIYVSGIPLLEKAGHKKWKENAEYKAYIQRTPVLIPYIGRKGRAPF